jgi:WD40 repeat protein
VADLGSDHEPYFYPGVVRLPMVFSPDGTLLTGDDQRRIRVWEPATAKVLRQWPAPAPLHALQFGPDGKTLLLRFGDHSAQLCDAALGRPTTPPLFHRGAKILVSAFSPDGRTVLTGCQNRTAWLWDAATGKQLGPPRPHPAAVTALAVRPDGRKLVTGCADGTILLWPMPGEEPGAAEDVRQRLEALTGLRLDARGLVQRAGADSAP